MEHNHAQSSPDIVLIGAGIMSATLGFMLKELDSALSIEIIERLDVVAGESSDAWNNAGTGHSALCELNYTPQSEDGSIEIQKAIKIAESFEVSKEFWAFLIEKGYIQEAKSFINSIPHMSFVWGEENVEFLRKRYEALKQIDLFSEMEYTTDTEVIAGWVPLIMNGRDPDELVAATRVEMGTDVNFGCLTRSLIKHLEAQPGVTIHLTEEVRELHKSYDTTWHLEVKDLRSKASRKIQTKFVFIGAGGGSLLLLEKSAIPESKGFGGFPVSGQWLRCINESIISRHDAKVYGKAAVGAPPMSVPHLDTRMIGGKKALLFGPYAGFSTKFLKNGSYLDLPLSIKVNNIGPMISAGLDNIPLTKYLISQVTQSPEDRLDALREYMPEAVLEDWELETAGQRVQVIKKNPHHGGVLEFGTEMVTSADHTIAALLGASPGASTAVSIMLELLEKCFPDQMRTSSWQDRIKEMIPSQGRSLVQDPKLCEETRLRTSRVLELQHHSPMKKSLA